MPTARGKERDRDRDREKEPRNEQEKEGGPAGRHTSTLNTTGSIDFG